MIIRKHTEYESGHEHGPDCGCCTDSHFNQMCEEDPEYEEKSRQVNEEIKKEMIKIKKRREAKQRGES